MTINSNIAGVIRQTERLMARIPVAATAALQPVKWEVEAANLAQTILYTLATPAEAQFVPLFIKQITTGVFEGGLSLKMQTPFAPLRNILGQAQAAKGATSNKDLGMGLFDLPIREFEDLILKWVETSEEEGGKRRDARDTGKSDEQIAHLISHIMLSPDMDRSKKGRKAREKLTPHIEEFLKSGQANRLPPATVSLWLQAVLAGWREMVLRRYPAKLKAELAATKGEL